MSGMRTLTSIWGRLFNKQEFGYALEPIVRLSTGEAVGFELLKRPSPVDGCSVREWRTWYRALPERIDPNRFPQTGWVSLNLHSWQVLDPDIFRSVVRFALHLKTPLAIEGTEGTGSHTTEDLIRIARCLDKLRMRLGTPIILDDMGDGRDFHLKISHVRPDYGKIAGVLFHELRHEERRSTEVILSIRDLLSKVGASVIVEWLETPNDLSRAQSLDLSYGQGYLFPFENGANTHEHQVLAGR